MADNLEVTPGTGTTVGTDDVGGVHYQKIKLDAGGDGVSVPIIAGQQTSANSIPVVLSTAQEAALTPQVDALTDAELRATPIQVSATNLDIRDLTNADVVTAELSATDNAVLDAMAAVEGTTSGAAVITDANGTIQQYLRGLVKLLITTGTIVLGAGTAAIGKLAANANVDIGAVEIAPNANEVHGTSGAITGTTSTQVIAAQGSGQRIYVTSLLVTNSHAAVGTLVTIQDDAGSPVVLFAGYAAPAGGGFSITFPTPLPTTANQKLMAICGTTGANVYVSANGFKGA